MMTYMPGVFREPELARLHDLMDQESFGALVVAGAGAEPEIAHVPFLLERDRGEQGVLRGHVARANPIWRALDAQGAATVIFQGPHTYVSPQWYRSRQEVPTWNYAVVHGRCAATLVRDPTELRRLLALMAARFEEGDSKWSLEELGTRALDALLAEIVGFELELLELHGKFKLSQNRAEPDRRRVRAALRRRGRPADLAVARLMDCS